MKTSLALLFFLFAFCGTTYAQTTNNFDSDSDDYFYLGFGGLLDIPTQNQNNYSLGGGGELISGYCFSDNVSIQVRLDSFYFYGLNTSIYDLRPTVELKIGMDLKDFFLPYFFFGPGADIQYISINGTTNNNSSLAAVGGLGVQFDLGDQINLFLEGKYNLTFQNKTATNPGGLLADIPAEAGMTFRL